DQNNKESATEERSLPLPFVFLSFCPLSVFICGSFFYRLLGRFSAKEIRSLSIADRRFCSCSRLPIFL
ncbi:MAG TPA: hypothetical protein VMG10_23295, partial [Gemmataceae bacterium]|nr:hypothetical protein [Gemmataceae bacterium]